MASSPDSAPSTDSPPSPPPSSSSSSSSSPPPSSSDASPPPSESDSPPSPPPPSPSDAPPPPPPPPDATPPPPDEAPPPPDAAPPPPDATPSPSNSSSSSSSPPPTSQTSSSPPSPPPPPSPSPSPQSSTVSPSDSGSPPPPPASRRTPPTPGSVSRPPPPRSSGALSPPQTTSSSSDDSSSSSNELGIIVGVTVGAGIFLIALVLIFVARKRSRRKRRQQDEYYPNLSSDKKGKYFNASQHNTWHNSSESSDHVVKLQQPPGGGGGWAPPGIMNSGDMSSNYSDPSRPPPPPNYGTGFNKSSFSYEELAAATGGFSQENLLGQGGFGYVHKGVLANGKEIAVKSLKSGSGQGEREFQAEVDIISRVHHRHLVSLVGYCIGERERMLVYEFVPNNTLEYHLHVGASGRPIMDWASRMRIALGSAKGLAYLHEDCHPKIIHRDIKTANILIDNNYEAMVADFGLAKLSTDTNTHVSTRVMGTFGYLAPEYASSGKLTEKSDVFSYGVMLVELITGRRPVDDSNFEDSLVDWARPLLTRAMVDGNYEELVDRFLENNYESQEMARMVACAAASIRHSAKRRPKMSQIVRALEGDVSLDDLNDVRKTNTSVAVNTTMSSEYNTKMYNADMEKFKKMALPSQEFGSSEDGAGDSVRNQSSFGNSEEMIRH